MNRRPLHIQILAACLCVGLLLAGSNVWSLSETQQQGTALPETLIASPIFSGDYDHYLLDYETQPRPDRVIEIQAASFDPVTSREAQVLEHYAGRDQCAQIPPNATVVWEFFVPEAGMYQIQLDYISVEGNKKEIETSFLINGQIPFREAGLITFNLLWRDELEDDGSFRKDSRGNELIPYQQEVFHWLTADIRDTEGRHKEAFRFYLIQGLNTLEIHNADSAFVADRIQIYNDTQPQRYADSGPSSDDVQASGVTGVFQKVQGEHTLYKSHPILYPIYDRSSPSTEESDPVRIIRNTIGGMNWNRPHQSIIWEIIVPETGYYKIGIKYRQNFVRGFSTSRRILINDKLVYREMDNVRFEFTSVFKNKVLNDGTEDMLFYMEQGRNEIKMEVTLGDLTDRLRMIEAAQARLSEIYTRIIVVTGVAPDLNRDYDLVAEIPELLGTFSEISTALNNQYLLFEQLTRKPGSDAKILREISMQLKSLAEKPHTIPERLNLYQSNVSALAAWSMYVKSQPLEIDYLAVFSPEEEMPQADAGFFRKLIYELRSFIASFFIDYNMAGEYREDAQNIEVWVSAGREQSTILKDLTDSEFSSHNNINVNIKLVQGALLQSIMAGIGPDIALGLGRTDPVNLALRSALEPLNDYPDFDEVTRRFIDSAMDPYEFNGKHYALPETQSFHMMFYRKDVLDRLGIEPPDTWDDFYRISGIIQRNHMEIGLPYAGSVLTAESMSIFPTLLLQNAGTYYTPDKSATLLTEPIGIDTFIRWTQFYSLYSFPLVKDDYNRFRTGEMPITIMPYTFYSHLRVAATEINGLWEMVQIPGTVKEDKTIDRSEAATGSGAAILASAANKDACWEFLKWWTSKDTQAAYGNRIEMALGPAGRYPTANVAALPELRWSASEVDAIMAQWQWVREIPEVPGGYYLTRNLDNAFRAVVFRNQNARESLNYWDGETNKEITRRRIEYGLD